MNPLINSQQVKIYGLISFSPDTSVFVTLEDMDKPLHLGGFHRYLKCFRGILLNVTRLEFYDIKFIKFYGTNNQIGQDAGCVLEGTISLSTEYHFRFILGVQSRMR